MNRIVKKVAVCALVLGILTANTPAVFAMESIVTADNVAGENTVVNTATETKVKTEDELKQAIAEKKANIVLDNSIALEENIRTKENTVIDGQGKYTLDIAYTGTEGGAIASQNFNLTLRNIKKLTLSGGRAGLALEGKLVIENTEVAIKDTQIGISIYEMEGVGSGLEITNSTVTIEGFDQFGIVGSGDITITDSALTIQNEGIFSGTPGYQFSRMGIYLRDNSTMTAKNADITVKNIGQAGISVEEGDLILQGGSLSTYNIFYDAVRVSRHIKADGTKLIVDNNEEAGIRGISTYDGAITLQNLHKDSAINVMSGALNSWEQLTIQNTEGLTIKTKSTAVYASNGAVIDNAKLNVFSKEQQAFKVSGLFVVKGDKTEFVAKGTHLRDESGVRPSSAKADKFSVNFTDTESGEKLLDDKAVAILVEGEVKFDNPGYVDIHSYEDKGPAIAVYDTHYNVQHSENNKMHLKSDRFSVFKMGGDSDKPDLVFHNENFTYTFLNSSFSYSDKASETVLGLKDMKQYAHIRLETAKKTVNENKPEDEKTTTKDSNEKTTTDGAQTGDMNDITMLLLAFIISALVLFVAKRKKVKNK